MENYKMLNSGGDYEMIVLLELIENDRIEQHNVLLEYAFCDQETLPLQDIFEHYISIGFIQNSYLQN